MLSSPWYLLFHILIQAIEYKVKIEIGAKILVMWHTSTLQQLNAAMFVLVDWHTLSKAIQLNHYYQLLPCWLVSCRIACWSCWCVIENGIEWSHLFMRMGCTNVLTRRIDKTSKTEIQDMGTSSSDTGDNHATLIQAGTCILTSSDSFVSFFLFFHCVPAICSIDLVTW